LAEQLTLNQWVLGSSPKWITTETTIYGGFFLFIPKYGNF